MKLFYYRTQRIHVTRIGAILFFTAGLLHANAQSSHTLTAGTGIKKVQDDLLFNGLEKFSTANLAYSFTLRNSHQVKSIYAGFEKGGTTAGKNRFTTSEFALQYSNAYAVLNKSKGKWINYTGYGFLVNPQYIKSGDRHSWATTGAVSLYNSLQYSAKRSQVSLDISLPLAGFASRPAPGAGNASSTPGMLYDSFSDLFFTSLHNRKEFIAALRYQYGISDRLSVTAETVYSYQKLTSVQYFREQGWHLQAGLTYHLR